MPAFRFLVNSKKAAEHRLQPPTREAAQALPPLLPKSRGFSEGRKPGEPESGGTGAARCAPTGGVCRRLLPKSGDFRLREGGEDVMDEACGDGHSTAAPLRGKAKGIGLRGDLRSDAGRGREPLAQGERS